MRLFRVLLVALFGLFAVIAGLVTAAAVSVATALVVVVRRALRSTPSSSLPRARSSRRVPRGNTGEVIDITATEVPVESGRR